MRPVPNPGDVIPLESGDATIFEVKVRSGSDVTVLAARNHPVHPFATWKFDQAGLYAGRYFKTLGEAEVDYDQR